MTVDGEAKQLARRPSVEAISKKVHSYGAMSEKPLTAQAAQQASFAGTGVPPICMCILIVELCERLAFYTFTGTQEFYLERNGYSLAQAGSINASMSTLCMSWALAAGWVADVALGRYQTIVVLGIVYAAGALFATLGALPSVGNPKLYLFGVMVLVPIGTAGIKANISNFGADQYDLSQPGQKAAQEKFFSWFYLAINIGSAVAYGYLTTMGSNGGMGVPREYGYFSVYFVASVCMLVAVGVFVSGRSQYRMYPPQRESPLGGVINHVIRAYRNGSARAAFVCAGSLLLMASIIMSVAQSIIEENQYSKQLMIGAFICAAIGVTSVIIPCLEPAWVTQQASSDEQVSPGEAESFLRILPVLMLGNMAFSALYNSMQYWYQQQACQMDLRVPFTSGRHQFAGSFFMIGDCLGIVIATPIAVSFVNPALEKAFNGFKTGAKYGLGMTFGVVSVLVAGNMEVRRRTAPVMAGEPSNCAPDGVLMSNMSAVWMFLPFILMGIGEIYTQPVLMHFAYTNSPASMRTVAAVMALVIGAVSNALFTLQIAALRPFVKDDLNEGHLEYGYYMNVVLGALIYLLFMMAMGRFERQSAALAERQP
eukprot:TRINITY_DN39604_c0_g3_i1.p1 TRINITY_DN39604_c0_g3~~TRINITY_DN39604_c0_g3_i1.p1  ORF type:complete len:596 (+),score=107.00 TRINITY_DN39604_c0_g3_i1:87-1874(+)